MRYVEDMRKATLAEFDKEEAEWRETAERQVLHLCEIEDPLPTPDELDAGALYEWLAKFSAQKIFGASECIEAALADAAMARRLEVAPGSALPVAHRRSHAEGEGRPNT